MRFLIPNPIKLEIWDWKWLGRKRWERHTTDCRDISRFDIERIRLEKRALALKKK